MPDLLSLRFRTVGWTGFVAGSFGVLLAFSAIQLDSRRCEEVARVRAITLAETAGLLVDGDAHANLGPDQEKRLADAASSLAKLLQTSGYPGVVRTLRPRPEAQAVLAAKPGSARAAALEVVLATGEKTSRTDVDYRPVMENALFEKRSASELAAGQVWAYAPVPDSWGSTPGLVWVAGPATSPLWRRLVFGASAILLAGLLASLSVWLAHRAAGRLERAVSTLDVGVRELASGRMPGAFTLARRAPSELVALAAALETLRARLEAAANGQPLPPPPATAGQAERAEQLGEAADFDLALLLQQLVEPARKMAQTRNVELQLVFPDGLPTQLRGHPVPLFRALDSLMRNALRNTAQGRITLRVSRAGGSADGENLRFEVADTSPGIAFKEQQELTAALAEAAQADPGTLKDSLPLASALARALGGELSFVSQPGQGSRFGFTATFHALSAPAGAPNQHAATAFQPRPVTGFQPRPVPPTQLPPDPAFHARPRVGSR